MDPVTIKAGDRLRINQAMIRVLIQAVQGNEGHVLVLKASASETEDGATDLMLVLGREPRGAAGAGPDLLRD